MIQSLLDKLIKQEDTRQTLIEIKELLRTDTSGKERTLLLQTLGGEFEVLTVLLASEDGKVRKNTALILGEIAVPKLMPILWEAYERETTRFVRTSYLTALAAFDYRPLLEEIKTALQELEKMKMTEDNRKHLQEEKLLLRNLIEVKEQKKPHRFTGAERMSELVLTTNRNHKHLLLDALGAVKKKEFNAGVMLQTKDPESLFRLRTFEEMFFVLPDCRIVPADPAKAAALLAEGKIAEYLAARHEDNGNPFYFRIELRGAMPLEKRSSFVRRMASLVEEKTGGRLANAVHGYEVEIRLIENREGQYNVLLKLYTLRDFRFAYRRKTIAAGMRPFNAALAVALAGEETVLRDGKREPYFREYARILDPFCGSGTLLIERAKYLKPKEMFGLDILEEAIEAARENTALADCTANYVNRDFFTFTREQLFDEIVTDMPFTVSEHTERKKEIEQLYQNFFAKAAEHLEVQGTMTLYTHNKELVKQYASKRFTVIKEMELSMRERCYLCLLVKNS